MGPSRICDKKYLSTFPCLLGFFSNIYTYIDHLDSCQHPTGTAAVLNEYIQSALLSHILIILGLRKLWKENHEFEVNLGTSEMKMISKLSETMYSI